MKRRLRRVPLRRRSLQHRRRAPFPQPARPGTERGALHRRRAAGTIGGSGRLGQIGHRGEQPVELPRRFLAASLRTERIQPREVRQQQPRIIAPP